MTNGIPYIPLYCFIELSESGLIGRGNKRTCYSHPNDSMLCIKVARKENTWHENVIEWDYINHLKKQDVPLEHFIDCYYWVHTNFGPGLVFERVVDEDGSPSPTLAGAIKNKRIGISNVTPMLEDLKRWPLIIV